MAGAFCLAMEAALSVLQEQRLTTARSTCSPLCRKSLSGCRSLGWGSWAGGGGCQQGRARGGWAPQRRPCGVRRGVASPQESCQLWGGALPPISCAHTWALVPDTHSCCKAMRLHWEEGHQDAEQLMPQGAGGGPRVGACRSVVFGQARSYLAVFPEPQPLFPMSPAVTGGVVFPGVLGRK